MATPISGTLHATKDIYPWPGYDTSKVPQVKSVRVVGGLLYVLVVFSSADPGVRIGRYDFSTNTIVDFCAVAASTADHIMAASHDGTKLYVVNKPTGATYEVLIADGSVSSIGSMGDLGNHFDIIDDPWGGKHYACGLVSGLTEVDFSVPSLGSSPGKFRMGNAAFLHALAIEDGLLVRAAPAASFGDRFVMAFYRRGRGEFAELLAGTWDTAADNMSTGSANSPYAGKLINTGGGGATLCPHGTTGYIYFTDNSNRLWVLEPDGTVRHITSSNVNAASRMAFSTSLQLLVAVHGTGPIRALA